MICLRCAALKPVRRGAPCPACKGPLVDETAETLEQLVAARLRLKLDEWHREGKLDAHLRDRLRADLPEAPTGDAPDGPSPTRRADALAARLPTTRALRPKWLDTVEHALRERDEPERRADAPDARDATSDASAAASAGLFGTRSTAPLTSGLHALAELDEGDASVRSVVGEYVWWFIGTLLVLAGSVMGVREAWLALGGTPRLLVVAFALLAYHGGFVGLSALVARKSGAAGRVLAGIALTLLPVVFAALSALVALSPVAGAIAVAAAVGAVALTLRTLSRRFERGDAMSLGLAFLPCLLAELPLSSALLPPDVRVALPLAGVVACGFAARRGLGALALALYGTVALAVFTVVGAPGSPAIPLPFGSLGFVAVMAWAATCAVAVAPALADPKAHEAFPHAAPAGELVALAVASAAAVAAFAGSLSLTVGADTRADTFAAVVPLLAAAAFAIVRSHRPRAVHPAIVFAVLSALLTARLQWQGAVSGWMLGPAAVGALLFVAARFTSGDRERLVLGAWGVLLALGSVVAARLLETGTPMRATVYAATIVAIAAHASGAWRQWPLHLAGGAAVLFGLEAFTRDTPMFVLAAFGAAATYAIASQLWLFRVPAERRQTDAAPLDDVSLAAALIGAALLLLAGFGATGALPPGSSWDSSLARFAPAAIAAGVLACRAFLDRSRAISALAAAAAGLLLLPSVLPAASFGGVALALAGLSLVRGGAVAAPARARAVLAWLSLPFPATGRLLWGDGFAAAALLFGVASIARTIGFLTLLDEPSRATVVVGAFCTLAVALLAFLCRGFASFGMRGNVATWAVAGALLVLGALANRLGRPLPPQVVGLRFTFIVPAVWTFAVLLRRFGPALGRRLDAEAHGPHYHWVPHLGVAALGLLCVIEGALVGGTDPTAFLITSPPLLWVASALAAVLLGRSFGVPRLVSAGLGLALVAAALAFAQQSLLGSALVQRLPATAWVLPGFVPSGPLIWERAALGLAVLGTAYAALAAIGAFPGPRARLAKWLWGKDALADQPLLPGLLAAWSERAAFAVFAAALLQPRPLPAALVASCGLFLRLAGERRAAGRVALFGFAALHAALAVASGVVPWWAGPATAVVAVATAASGVVRAARRSDEKVLWRAHAAACALCFSAVVWALAVGGAVDVSFALPSVLSSSATGLWSAWPRSAALPLTLSLVAAAQLTAATGWRGALRRWTLAGATFDVALAAAAAVAVVLERSLAATASGGFVYAPLVMLEGGQLSLAICAVAVAAHVASVLSSRDDTAQGFGLGRDLVGVLLAFTLALFIASGARTQVAFATGAAALAFAFIASLHAALRAKTGRHAWAAQVCVVGGYALVQAQWVDLQPAIDAVLGLMFGFVLVGVTVLARRGGVAPVAKATRAFAALLPVALVFVFPTASDRETALLAAASSLLYAVLATVEHSRFFGALAAVAANLALLVLALSQGLSGVEVFLGPLGLLLLVLAQLFKKTLPHPARNAVRIIGALLLYAPAAVKLSFQLGEAAEATYAVVFGAVCLLGVAAGMVLQIRAYLVMGTLFLTLDVVANLVNAGLRDYRVGFVVLSATGLLVLAAMVFATLKRDVVRAAVGRLRVRLRGWD